MTTTSGLSLVFWFCLFGCKGIILVDAQNERVIPENQVDSIKIQQLYNLFNESLLRETLSQFSVTQGTQQQTSQETLPNVLIVQSSTDRLFTSNPVLDKKIEEDFLASAQSEIIPIILTNNSIKVDEFLTNENNTTSFGLEDSFHTENNKYVQVDYKDTTASVGQPQEKFIVEILQGIFGGQMSSSISPGKPLVNNPPTQTTSTIDVPSTQKPTTKSPLEYKPLRPTYAGAPGGISGGHLGQLIPSGDPWPANPPTQNVIIHNSTPQNIAIEDRLKETTSNTVDVSSTQKPTTKSPLEYKPQRPTFAGLPGGISGGHLGQLIPSGDPWPANPPTQNVMIQNSTPQNIALEDRLKDTTISTVDVPSTQKPTTKSPLEYKPLRPTYAGSPGGISGGHLGQLIPSGDPWPANPPTQNIIIQNSTPQNIALEDRLKETTTSSVHVPSTQKPTTKSPLEYKPQRPTFVGLPGGISGGHLGQLIPSGDPWPANSPTQNVMIQNSTTQNTGIEDRLKETTTSSVHVPSTQKSTTKSPLEYKPQRPTFAGSPGGISGGHLGQLIPSGDPWPANPPTQNLLIQNSTPQNIAIEDHLKETTTITVDVSSTQKSTTKSPLEYKPQRPTFAGLPGGISGGHLGQLIPSGDPWSANPPTQNVMIQNSTPQNIGIEDRLKETTANSLDVPSTQKTITKSPLEYKPQRPSYAGELSSGYWGLLIPPGRPWPADPPKETSVTIAEVLPSQKPITRPLTELLPQKPSFVGMPEGYLAQLLSGDKLCPAGEESF